jgi:hypothetical protein
LTSLEDTSVALVQPIEPGRLRREPNLSINEYLDDYGIIQDLKATNLKSV